MGMMMRRMMMTVLAVAIIAVVCCQVEAAAPAGTSNITLGKPVYSYSETGNQDAWWYNPPSNLVDGVFGTAGEVEPGNSVLDYEVDLQGWHHVSTVTLTWGRLREHIVSWNLMVWDIRTGGWVSVGHGGAPNGEETTVTLDCVPWRAAPTDQRSSWANVIRIQVQGSTWLTINELTAFGKPASGFPGSGYDGANVALGAPVTGPGTASRLTDGVPQWVAEPGGDTFTYTVDLLDEYYLGEVTMFWGDWGTVLGIHDWKIEGYTGLAGPWVTLGEGGFPSSTETTVMVNQRVSMLRVSAIGYGWIGIGELVARESVPYDDGYADGEAAHANDYTNGYNAGYNAGYGAGQIAGYSSGYTDGWNDLLNILPPGIKRNIESQGGFAKPDFQGGF